MYPRISIITPNLNMGAYLEETINSVLSQNYPNLEYIVIDGGSSDNSVEIIKKYEKKLAFWISEKDKGMYHAIQKGFEKATGELMAWINSDDKYHTNSFFTIAEIFSSFPVIEWISGTNTTFDELGRTVYCGQARSFNKYDFYNRDFRWIQQESVFWRRSLWDKTGSSMNLKIKFAGDFDLWLRFFQHSELYLTNALVGGFRLRSSNQFSTVYRDEYLSEVNTLLDNAVLSHHEKKVLRKYKMALILESIIKKSKVLKTGYILKKFRTKQLPKTSMIYFDRTGMKFMIH